MDTVDIHKRGIEAIKEEGDTNYERKHVSVTKETGTIVSKTTISVIKANQSIQIKILFLSPQPIGFISFSPAQVIQQ